MSEANEYEGYPLFNDVTDKELRIHNRAITMANIYEDHQYKGKVQARTVLLLAKYLRSVPNGEKAETYERFNEVITARGIRCA
jgi:hypothetical protein